MQIIQPCLLNSFSQDPGLPSFNETNIFAKSIYFSLSSSFPEWFFYLLVFFIYFISDYWAITNTPNLTRLLSSVILLVCTKCIASFTNLFFSLNLTLSVFLLRFWSFGKSFFFNSSKIFKSMVWFSTVSKLSQLINSSAFSSPVEYVVLLSVV